MKTDAHGQTQYGNSHDSDRHWQQALAFGALSERDVRSVNLAAPPTTGAAFEVMP